MSHVLIVMIVLTIMFCMLFAYAMAKTAGEADENMEKIFRKMQKKEEKTNFERKG